MRDDIKELTKLVDSLKEEKNEDRITRIREKINSIMKGKRK